MAQPYAPYPYGGQPGAPVDPAYYANYQQQQGYGYPPGAAYPPGQQQQYPPGYYDQQQQAYWYAQQQQPGAPPLPGEPPHPMPPGAAPPQQQQQQQPMGYGAAGYDAAAYYGQQGGYGPGGYDPAMAQQQGYGGWGQQQQYGAQPPYPQQQPPAPPQQPAQQPPQPSQQQPPLPEPPQQQQQPAARAPTTTPQQRGGAPLNYSAVPPPASLAPRPRAPPTAVKPAGSLAPAAAGGAAAGAGAAGVAADAVARMRAAAQAKAAELAAAARNTPKSAPRLVPGAPVAAAASAAAASAAAAPKGLPAALSAWVQRCLEVYKTPQDKAWIKEHLKDYMITVRSAGTLWTTDWDRHPIPRPPWAAAGGKGGGAGDATPGTKRGWGGLFADSSSEDERGFPAGGRGGGRGAAGKKLTKKQKKQHAAAAARGGAGGLWSAEEARKRAQRAGRFDLSAAPGDFTDRVEYMRHKKRLVEMAAEANGDDIDWDRFKIVGTCMRLEKSYLRLTSAPDPGEVRPPVVLRKALERLLGLVAKGEGGGYFYYNDQFKAMRQDLTVQGIKDGLAVEVYEAHARAALEYGDHAEYNQCQAQLALLYAAAQPGACAEFAAYRLLYQAVHWRHGEGRKLGATLRQVLEDKVGSVSSAPEVAHALAVRCAIASRAYARFFELYASAPGLGRALMDVHAPAMRWHALNTLARAYRPAVPLAVLAAGAGFSPREPRPEPEPWDQQQQQQQQGGGGGSGGAKGRPLPGRRTLVFPGEHGVAPDESQGLAAAEEWALSCGAVLIDGPGGERLVDCKASCGRGVLHPPPEKDKVAHGDANLDINDFLAKIL